MLSINLKFISIIHSVNDENYENTMHKKYLAVISLIVFAFILNAAVLGTLVSQPKTQSSDTIAQDSASKVTVSVNSTSLTSSSMNSSLASAGKLTITNVAANWTAGSFLVSISNDNSSQKAIANLFVNNYSANLENNIGVPGNSSIKLLVTLTDGVIFGQTYQIRLLSSEGQSEIYYEIVD